VTSAWNRRSCLFDFSDVFHERLLSFSSATRRISY
jgi:hypothetical protein